MILADWPENGERGKTLKGSSKQIKPLTEAKIREKKMFDQTNKFGLRQVESKLMGHQEENIHEQL